MKDTRAGDCKILKFPTNYAPYPPKKDDVINSVVSTIANMMLEPIFQKDTADYKKIVAMQTILTSKNNELIFYTGALMDDLICSDADNLSEVSQKIYTTVEYIDKIICDIIKPTMLLSSRYASEKN